MTRRTRSSSSALHKLAGGREQALEAYLAADYQQALDLIRSRATTARGAERDILEARVLLRLGDSEAAAAVALKARKAAGSVDESVLAIALQASAQQRAGRCEEANSLFRSAREVAPRAHRTVRAELGYFEAVAAWARSDMSAAEDVVDRALSDADDVVAALLMQLQGWIEIRRERYASAAQRFDAAMQASQRSHFRDVRLEARLVHGLAVIASETIDLRLAARVRDFENNVRWSPGVVRERFNTTVCLCFLAMLRGDLSEAYRLGQCAVDEAPSEAFAAIAHTNLGALLLLAGDRFCGSYHLDLARRIIEATNWSGADVEERVALTNYAIEAGLIDPSGAAQSLTMYRSLTARQKRDLALEGDRRVEAFADMAEGRVAEALGQRERAVRFYEQSLRRWVSLDYRMRAALVASDLNRLTGSKRYQEEIESACRRAPLAWFGRPSREHKGTQAPPRLTPAQRRVLAELLQGKASKEIAQTLRRSDYTVRNQTKSIFDAFDVHTRAALIVKCQREGISLEASDDRPRRGRRPRRTPP